MITAYNGINVNKKLIPTNKHLDSGNMYLGIYTLFIKNKYFYQLVVFKVELYLLHKSVI